MKNTPQKNKQNLGINQAQINQNQTKLNKQV